MNKYARRFTSLILIGLSALLLNGCSDVYESVAPSEFGLLKTPTGLTNDVLTNGQYDLGKEVSGKGNELYLIDAGGFPVKEAFTKEGNADGGDHRCSMKGAQPLTLDVRFFMTIPDVLAENGGRHLARLMTLTNAEQVEGRHRVFKVYAKQVYTDQAQQEVRAKIRQYCNSFKDFSEAEKAFSDEGPNGMSKRIEKIVRDVLREKQIPLILVSAQPSNMKPDQSVIDALAAINAAQAKIDAVKAVVTYLEDDATGYAWLVYKMQMLREIADLGKGNTVVMDVGSEKSGNVIPLPLNNK